MPVEDGEVGIDKTCTTSDINIFEISVGEGVGVITISTARWKRTFNFPGDFLTALRWDMGEREVVVRFDGRTRWLRNLLLVLLRCRLFLQQRCRHSLVRGEGQ